MGMRKICMTLCIILFYLCLQAQNQSIDNPDHKTDWWGDPEGYLNQQAKVTLDIVGHALTLYPPALPEPLERKMALVMIDNVLHDEKAAYRPAVQAFLQKRIGLVANDILKTEVKKGAVIWKLYDHAFIVKTASVTIGFDIQRGLPAVEGFTLSKELTQKIIDVVDILFISHFHGDHADPWVAEMFLNQKKPVVTPPNLWNNLPIYSKITHPERSPSAKQAITLPGKGLTINYYSFPGHQGEKILNNVNLIFTPEGLSFAHTGDQSYEEDFVWIDQIGKNHSVDVLLVNSWSVYPGNRTIKGFQPKLVIPGHENEMGHTIDHREPYWLNYNRLGDSKEFPWVQMAWGEKFHYTMGN
jgi:L-ascorbate metabolism protein UlaG (beta-lactamase superfamily)